MVLGFCLEVGNPSDAKFGSRAGTRKEPNGTLVAPSPPYSTSALPLVQK